MELLQKPYLSEASCASVSEKVKISVKNPNIATGQNKLFLVK